MKLLALPLALMLFGFAFYMVSGVAAGPSSSSAADVQQRLVDAGASISTNSTTGAASFVRVTPGAISLSGARTASAEASANAFLSEYGSVFGITDVASQLSLGTSVTDGYGATRVAYTQMHNGVPVYGSFLYVHFAGSGDFTAANGTTVPNIKVDTMPAISAELAQSAAMGVNAMSLVAADSASVPADAVVIASKLVVYRDGLIQGIANGADRLVYEIELFNGSNYRELVYVDAHSGSVVERISLVHQALNRNVYEAGYGPANLVWTEGDAFPYVGGTPTQTVNINNILNYTEDSYNMFYSVSGGTFDSWDNNGSAMEIVNNDPSINCPNANWNGVSTNYCNGVTADDTVAHEWGHAYTQETHGLIYAWQPGALNESYSDIWGEVADFMNGEGTDSPLTTRVANDCSIYGGAFPATLIVNAPASIAGPVIIASAVWNVPDTIVTGNLVLGTDADDEGGDASFTDACQDLTNADDIAGNIALVDRGTCTFSTKVANAEAAGAIGLVVVDDGRGIGGMGGTGNIPAVMVSVPDGQTLKDNLPDTNATIRTGGAGSDDSYRWLSGEDDPAFGGAIRDMWNPTCYGDPGKVSDVQQYICGTGDSGGVHTNSGIPNHAFALIVDGGDYNGQSITGMGLTKASAIYWRAQTVYQGPASKFADHADALEMSCSDLMGQDIYEINTDAPIANVSSEVITAADCAEVTKAIAAVEFRTDPDFCEFEPLLQNPAPPVCADASATPIFSEDFTTDPGWALSNTGVFTEYNPRDWTHVETMPAGRTGGLFGIDSVEIGDCSPGSDDQSGVMFVDTPALPVPPGGANDRLVIEVDHYVATEVGWDGGNVWASVNGGEYVPVPASAFIFNGYNAALQTAGSGNTNPLAGMDAFTGADGGEVVSSWGKSQLDVTSLGVVAGDTVSLRLALGVDGCNGNDGWYIDKVDIYMCEAPAAAADVDASGASSTQISDVTNSGVIVVDNVGSADLSCSWFEGNVWDQPADASGGIISNYWFDPPPAGVYTADDFVIEYSVDVESISAPGFSSNSPTVTIDTAAALNWYIYADAGGPEGIPLDGTSPAPVWVFTSTVGAAGVDVAGETISLDLAAAGAPALTLAPGKYWLSVFPDTDFTQGGRWNWSQGVAQGSSAVLTDPDSVFGLPPGWFGLPALGLAWSDVAFNIGGGPEGCTSIDDVPWLSVDSCGTVPFGSSLDINVMFDSTGYEPGTYTENICLLTNDPNNPYIAVPVTMVVEEANPSISITKTVGTDAAACATDTAITVEPGTDVYYCVTIENTGNAPFLAHDIVDGPLSIALSNVPYGLNPGASISTVALGAVFSQTITTHVDNTVSWVAYSEMQGGDDPVALGGGQVYSATASASAMVTASLPPTSVSVAGGTGSAAMSSVWLMVAALSACIVALGAFTLRRRSQL